jgi:flavin reductase (DIM6/NTAB) family NADH-FMN oxidoreductase RutF
MTASSRPETRRQPRTAGQRVTAPVIDQRVYRDVVGRFATGVTVVTFQNEYVTRGMTANAVSSLSLDPTLLLVCVAKNAMVHSQLEDADAFAVNILAEDQMEISRTFAQRGIQSMADVPYRTGKTGAPIIEGALAWFECEVYDRLSGGDHTIYIGRVIELSLERPEAGPLLFYGGAYRSIGDQL